MKKDIPSLELEVFDRSFSRLCIYTEDSTSYDDDLETWLEGDSKLVAMLWVPDIAKPEHDHIEMDLNQAIKLRDWLNEYIKLNK